MRGRRKRLIVSGLLAIEALICITIVAVLAISGSGLPPIRFFYFADTRAEETVEERFVTEGPATLDLTNTRGDVQIIASDEDRFVVKAVKEAWGRDKKDAEAKLQALEVKMTQDGDTLRIEVEDPEESASYIGIFYRSRANQVRFEISVPRQTAVVAYTHDGDLTLEGTEGGADLANHYGPVAVEDVTGDVTADTHHGEVAVRRSGGDQAAIDLTSHYGRITIEDVAGDIAADTHNGGVTVRRSGGERAAVNLTSHYGSITVRQVTAGSLNLDSHHGALTLEDVTVDGDLGLNTHYGKVGLDIVQAGHLEAKSNNGNITLNEVQLEGALDLFTHYGTVRVADTEASAYKIETHNGAITLDGGHGSLWLHSHYGDITVRDAHDATLDLDTTNGNVSVEGSLSAASSHEVESHYGSVSLWLPSDTSVFLDANTTYGHIRCDFDVLVKGGQDDQERDSDGDELRGPINDGSAKLRIKTHNGDINVEKRQSE
jgi:DUF4097 and DUF4098 domain-containing protein YvlB